MSAPPHALGWMRARSGFLGLQKRCAAPQAVIVPFGLEASVSYGRGTARGPSAILRASHQVELYDEEFRCEAWERYGVATLKAPRPAARLETALAQLAERVRGVLAQGQFPLILGGEHALTAGAIRPFAAAYRDLVVLHFDAHADLRDSYRGEKFSHAAVMRRVLEHSGLRLISFGVRSIAAEEMAYYESARARITIHWARSRKDWNLARALAPLKNRPIYVSFDVDALDAALMPATGTPEPGGLSWDEALQILRQAAALGTFVGADITELAPRAQWQACDFVAAKLAYKILNYAFLVTPHSAHAKRRAHAKKRAAPRASVQ